MAMPKKRLSHSKSGTRRSQISATLPTITFCPKCHSPRLAHTVCKECGTYRGKVVIDKTVVKKTEAEAEESK